MTADECFDCKLKYFLFFGQYMKASNCEKCPLKEKDKGSKDGRK